MSHHRPHPEGPYDPRIHSMPTADSPSGAAGAPAPPIRGVVDPDRIGSYQIVSQLGQGGFGTVYLADQLEPVRRRVALKIVSVAPRSDRLLARFEAERQALAMMDHPGVAAMFDAGSTPDGRPYFAMEHVAGWPITTYCDERALGVEDRVRLMVRVCEAVQHAHQKGVIHRDLKPANILVEEVDGRAHPKVIDFGVAKAIGQPLTDTPHQTLDGQVVGTPEYMAPEQARGDVRDVDTRADVYSLGVVLYELLTGRTPVAAEVLRAAGLAGLAGALTGYQIVRPSDRVSREGSRAEATDDDGVSAEADRVTLARRLRGDLDWIVMRCLEKDREHRYASVGDVGEELRRYLNDQPVLAGPPSAAYRVSKFVRRHRALVVSAAVVGAALMLGAIGTGVGLAWALRERDTARQQESEALAARDESDAVTAFLSEMLSSVSPAERGREVLVRDVLDVAARDLRSRFEQRPNARAQLSSTIGNAYRELGSPAEAARHLAEAYQIRRSTLGAAHPTTLRALANLAGLRHQQGRIDEAVTLMEQAMTDLASAPEADAQISLGIMNNLAQAYSRLGRLDQAVVMQRRAVAEMARTLGERDPVTLGATVNLASMLIDAGSVSAGEQMLAQAAEDARDALGADHPVTLLAQNTRGMQHFDAERFADAEPVLRQVAADRERVLGADHLDTIGTMANLGLTLTRLGRPDEAESVLSKAWERAQRAVGVAHPTTFALTTGLLELEEARGWPPHPQGHYDRLLAALRTAAASPDASLADLNSVAWYLLHIEPPALRDVPGALAIATTACERARRDASSDLWMFLDTLAEAQFAAGNAEAALATQIEALARLPQRGERYRAEMEERRARYQSASSDADPKANPPR